MVTGFKARKKNSECQAQLIMLKFVLTFSAMIRFVAVSICFLVASQSLAQPLPTSARIRDRYDTYHFSYKADGSYDSVIVTNGYSYREVLREFKPADQQPRPLIFLDRTVMPTQEVSYSLDNDTVRRTIVKYTTLTPDSNVYVTYQYSPLSTDSILLRYIAFRYDRKTGLPTEHISWNHGDSVPVDWTTYEFHYREDGLVDTVFQNDYYPSEWLKRRSYAYGYDSTGVLDWVSEWSHPSPSSTARFEFSAIKWRDPSSRSLPDNLIRGNLNVLRAEERFILDNEFGIDTFLTIFEQRFDTAGRRIAKIYRGLTLYYYYSDGALEKSISFSENGDTSSVHRHIRHYRGDTLITLEVHATGDATVYIDYYYQRPTSSVAAVPGDRWPQPYPNPTTGDVWFNAYPIGTNVTVVDAIGRTIRHHRVRYDTERLSLVDLPIGVYTLFAEHHSQRCQYRVLKR